MKAVILLCFLILHPFLVACQQEAVPPQKSYASWMADSEMLRNPDGWTIDFNAKPKWEYTHGLIMMAMLKVYEQTKDPHYLNYVKHFSEFMIQESGEILTYKLSDYNIDRVNGGKFLITLYKYTNDQRYLLALNQLRQQMREHPRNSEGGFWHKKVYPHQMWLDGLYMGAPFLAQYAATFDDQDLWDDIFNQFYLVDKYHYTPENGLYHHAYDESKSERWADTATGLSKNYWGRSIGWLAMAMIDVLDYFPVEHPKRATLEAYANQLAQGIIAYQHESGTWYQVVDQAEREGNYLEASVSSMLAYFLLKGTENGVLKSTYRAAGIQAYEGILQMFISENPDGTLTMNDICGVAGLGGNPYRDGSFEYYIGEPIRPNDPKGVGPFILASLVYENLTR